MSTDTAISIPTNVPALIDGLGGVGRVSEEAAIPLGTVSAWKTRARIPSDNWQKIIDLAKAKGMAPFDANTMLAIHNGNDGASA